MASDREIEIRVRVGSNLMLKRFLSSQAKFLSKEHQIDRYFSPRDRTFLKAKPVREWLRLRSSGGVVSLNYKNWHFDKDGKSHFCDEYETVVEDLIQGRKILEALGFEIIGEVDKDRKIYRYDDYEISLDVVKNLGSFVEIEYKGKSTKNPSVITGEMVDFLKTMACGQIERNYQGYPFLILFPGEAKYEKI